VGGCAWRAHSCGCQAAGATYNPFVLRFSMVHSLAALCSRTWTFLGPMAFAHACMDGCACVCVQFWFRCCLIWCPGFANWHAGAGKIM
jgi:hypothetical protein